MVAQAAIHQGLALDAFPLAQDPFAASEVDFSGREVAQALMGSGMPAARYRVPVRRTCRIDSVTPPRRVCARSRGRSTSS